MSYPPGHDRVRDSHIPRLIIHLCYRCVDPSACHVTSHRLRRRETAPSITMKLRINSILLIEAHEWSCLDNAPVSA
jgi:hypothetical protein